MFRSNKKMVGLVTLLVIGFILVQQVSPLATKCFASINDDNVRIGIKSIRGPIEWK